MATATRGKGARGRGRGGRNARPTKKTAEELDSEMADYWETGANANGADATATAQPAANGDAAMDDEILVGFLNHSYLTYTNSNCSKLGYCSH